MASNPSYVALAPRLTRGLVADVESGWSIAGLDVRKFPADKQAAKFVKKALADGRLEPASKAQWDEVHDTEEIEGEALEGRARASTKNIQEAHIRRAAQAGAQRLVESRSGRSAAAEDDEEGDDEDDGLDDLRKPQLVAIAQQMDLDTSGNMDTLKERIREARANGDDEDDSEE
jgi:hypothetical protein